MQIVRKIRKLITLQSLIYKIGAYYINFRNCIIFFLKSTCWAYSYIKSLLNLKIK